MTSHKKKPIEPNTPVIFSDGTDIFNKIAKTYIKHDFGLFILAPSGSGKTYFVERQAKLHWIDGDYLWDITNADPLNDEWEPNFDLVQEINDRSDIITIQAKKLGFWIIGSSNHFLKPDAIVIPSWSIHKEFIKKRQQLNYDGGAKEEDFEAVIEHRDFIVSWEKQGVPRFESIDEAVVSLSPETS